MDLENIIANSKYLNALKRERPAEYSQFLRFPHYSVALEWEKELAPDIYNCSTATLRASCERFRKEPIGGALFRRYIEQTTDKDIQNISYFLKSTRVLLVTTRESKKTLSPVEYYKDFFAPKAPYKLPPECFPDADCKSFEDPKIVSTLNIDLIRNIYQKSLDNLGEAGFKSFRGTEYYARFLQWKWLEKQAVTVDNFRYFRAIGRGGFGSVTACHSVATGAMYAAKRLDKHQIRSHAELMYAKREWDVMDTLRSRFLVYMAYSFETEKELYLLMNLMECGTLHYHIYEVEEMLPESTVLFYAAQIVLGLAHLHKHGYLYRDLKPQNVLMDGKGNTRIGDFGLVVSMDQWQNDKDYGGTVGYMPPEVIEKRSMNHGVDWFALGVVIYEMTTRKHPFILMEGLELRDKTLSHKPLFDDTFSTELRHLCRALLAKNAEARLGCIGGCAMNKGAAQVMSHAAFAGVRWEPLKAGALPAPYRPSRECVYAENLLRLDPASAAVAAACCQREETASGATPVTYGVNATAATAAAATRPPPPDYSVLTFGARTVPWQNEMIDTRCFADLNIYTGADGVLVDDLNPSKKPEEGVYCDEKPIRAKKKKFFNFLCKEPPEAEVDATASIRQIEATLTELRTHMRANTEANLRRADEQRRNMSIDDIETHATAEQRWRPGRLLPGSSPSTVTPSLTPASVDEEHRIAVSNAHGTAISAGGQTEVCVTIWRPTDNSSVASGLPNASNVSATSGTPSSLRVGATSSAEVESATTGNSGFSDIFGGSLASKSTGPRSPPPPHQMITTYINLPDVETLSESSGDGSSCVSTPTYAGGEEFGSLLSVGGLLPHKERKVGKTNKDTSEPRSVLRPVDVASTSCAPATVVDTSKGAVKASNVSHPPESAPVAVVAKTVLATPSSRRANTSSSPSTETTRRPSTVKSPNTCARKATTPNGSSRSVGNTESAAPRPVRSPNWRSAPKSPKG